MPTTAQQLLCACTSGDVRLHNSRCACVFQLLCDKKRSSSQCRENGDVLFNTVQVPHYNYVGDSILGTHSHMGAGSITSNVKSDKTLVVVKNGDEQIETGLKKFGAMLGDYVEVGCNSVLNPGTVIGRHCNVYPLSSVRGVIPEGHIFKDKNNIIKKK